MADCDTQDNARRWIVVVVSVVIGFSGLVFGLISNASERELTKIGEDVEMNETDIRENRSDIGALQRDFSVAENELRHIKNGIDRVEEKVDKLLENNGQ